MKFVKESIIRAARERVFAFHELPDAFERLIPPWENARILQKADITKIGSRGDYRTKDFRFDSVALGCRTHEIRAAANV